MIFNGVITIFIILYIIPFNIVIIVTTVFIIILLKVNIYKISPNIRPKNINNRKLPSEKLYIQNIMLIPVNIQNKISSIYVIRFIVLNVFLSILKKSNNNPINIPFNVKIKNKYAWLIANVLFS